MNFYTVASKMLKKAEKVRQQAEQTIEMAKDRGLTIPEDIDPEKMFDNALKHEYEKFKQTCELGIDLMSHFTKRINSLKQTNGERWYFITVRPPHDTSFDKFKLTCESFCNKWAYKWIECVYVYEQKGETRENAGFGFHWHMRFCTETINYYPSHILRDLFKAFDFVAKNCIRVDTVNSLERCIEYMQGDKKSDSKKPAVLMDEYWRETIGLPAEVKYKTRQAIE